MKLTLYKARLGQTKFDCFTAGVAFGRLFEAVDRAEAAAIRENEGEARRFIGEAERHLSSLRLALPILKDRRFVEVGERLEDADANLRISNKDVKKALAAARFILVEHGRRKIQDDICK